MWYCNSCNLLNTFRRQCNVIVQEISAIIKKVVVSGHQHNIIGQINCLQLRSRQLTWMGVLLMSSVPLAKCFCKSWMRQYRPMQSVTHTQKHWSMNSRKVQARWRDQLQRQHQIFWCLSSRSMTQLQWNNTKERNLIIDGGSCVTRLAV